MNKVVFIREAISEDVANNMIALTLYLDSLDKKRIYYWLNCPGGDVSLLVACSYLVTVPVIIGALACAVLDTASTTGRFDVRASGTCCLSKSPLFFLQATPCVVGIMQFVSKTIATGLQLRL
jgi:hypothetical protein